jgi:hypothetical protein
MVDVSNGQDVIDSRDVIKRIEDLESERDSFVEVTEAEDEETRSTLEAAKLKEWEETEEGIELKALQSLAEEAEGYASDWRYGEALIRDSYFEEYAEQLAEDIGAIDHNAKWPLNHIDWEAAADELKQDYTSVSYGDVEYWVRCS